MKKLIILSSLLLIAGFTGFSQSDPYKSAISYNDYIVGQQSQLMEHIINLSTAMEAGDNIGIQQHFKGFYAQSEKAVNEIKALKCYQGDCALRDASISLFVFYNDIANNEYKELIDILLKETITDSDQTRMNVLVESVTTKEALVDDTFAKAQTAFAKKNGFSLTDNELQDQIDGMNK